MSDDSSFATSKLSPEQRDNQKQYANIDVLIGHLYLAAIDASMVEAGFRMPTSVVHADDAPETVLTPHDLAAGYWKDSDQPMEGEWVTWVERPGADGTNGGRTIEYYPDYNGQSGVQRRVGTTSDRYVSKFDDIRKQVHLEIEKFLDMPDPQAAADVANIYTGISGQLDPGYGTMTASIGEIKTHSDVLKGTAAETYKTSFLNCFGLVLDSYCGLAGVLAQFMGAQAAMWAAARADVIGVIKSATDAYNTYATKPPAGSGFNWDVLIQIGKVVLAAAGIFTPEGGAVKKVASLGGAILETLPKEEEKVSHGIKSPEDVFDHIYKAGLASVNEQVTDVEDQIYTDAGSVMGSISGSRSAVRQNWQLPIAVADLSGEKHITWEYEDVNDICHVDMPNIVAKLDQLVSTARIEDADLVCSVLHHDGLGRGHYGPGLALQELNDMFCDLLGFFREQVSRGGENLWDAYQFACNADDATRAALAASTANLEGLTSLNGYQDPWIYTTTPAPTSTDQQMYGDWLKALND